MRILCKWISLSYLLLFRLVIIGCFCLVSSMFGVVSLGVDVFFEQDAALHLKGKRVGLILNQTSVDSKMKPTLARFLSLPSDVKVAALFSPEHGLQGQHYAWEKIADGVEGGLPVYSLHGETRRPTESMLKGLDVVIYDIQCTGVRAYTYPTTLFYMMEEAAKYGIEVIVLDRPNPINGMTVDGPLLEEKWRSYIGYINVPYCHGMTIGELAQFFNAEYKVGCKLRVVPMKGWKRSMRYCDTELAWIPPSPNVPEPGTPLFCSATGILGELQWVSIGIGYTLPFKIVGAPWIKAADFAEKLNAQKLLGIRFQPYYFKPFWGLYKGECCEGVLLHITDEKLFRPLTTQYVILGLLKSLYPHEFEKQRGNIEKRKELFCKANGTEMIYEFLCKEKYPAWKCAEVHKAERIAFLEKRKKYLLDYPLN